MEMMEGMKKSRLIGNFKAPWGWIYTRLEENSFGIVAVLTTAIDRSIPISQSKHAAETILHANIAEWIELRMGLVKMPGIPIDHLSNHDQMSKGRKLGLQLWPCKLTTDSNFLHIYHSTSKQLIDRSVRGVEASDRSCMIQL